jgi:hypothetical protein
MRPISEIARDIKHHWQSPYFGAVPYIQAMLQLHSITDMYGFDDARGIILYFLSNANTFRGEHARRLKSELKDILNQKG